MSRLLEPDDANFLESIERGTLPIGEEIGLLALQRLKDIAATSTSRDNQREARKYLKNIGGLSENISDSQFHYHPSALKGEIYKLALHALQHPDNKIALLGTARAVNAMGSAINNVGIYLNCEEDLYTWELNRAWMQAAAAMGYTFHLVEQHFPDIEQAIISGDPFLLLTQLAREIRSAETKTQYTRGDSPSIGSRNTIADGVRI